jgi:hypothetical protein
MRLISESDGARAFLWRRSPMIIDKRDREMMALSVPTVDLFELRDDLDRLEDAVIRLEKVVECLIELYRSERLKNWKLILREMLRKEEQKKGNYGNRAG